MNKHMIVSLTSITKNIIRVQLMYVLVGTNYLWSIVEAVWTEPMAQ